MESIEKLRLEENLFSGTIGSAFGTLKNLEVLVLSDNNELSGELPPELGQLSKLSRLMAPNTNIDGIVPEEICSLTNDYALTDFVMTCRGRGMEGGVLCSCCTECKSDLEV
jgi:Leucine-rich repeat (LRR) protein